MGKKKATPKKRVTTITLNRLAYDTHDVRIGDRVTFDGAWQGKQVGNRTFKVIDIETVVIADAEGRTAVVRTDVLSNLDEGTDE